MNNQEKEAYDFATSLASKIKGEFEKGEISQEEFNRRNNFAQAVIQKATFKDREEEKAKVGSMSRAEHIAYAARIERELAESRAFEQEAIPEKTPEQVDALVEAIKTGKFEATARKIANMTREEHQKFTELFES